MTQNTPPTGSPLDQLIDAWRIALKEPNGATILATFLSRTRDILDLTRLTRPWHDNDLPPYHESPYELRGPLRSLRQWRIKFYRLAISALAIALHERGHKPFGREFWFGDFPALWQQVTSGGSTSNPMPIAPSTRRPPEAPFAFRPDYCDWVDSELHRRLSILDCGIAETLSGTAYKPAVADSFDAYSQALSAASAILMADKLGLGQDSSDRQLRELIEGWLNPAIDDPFKFRFRGDSQLWPDWKYVYVDLGLAAVLGQVLLYDPNDLEAESVIRSLPLKEANTRTVGQDVVHTALRRIDMELAVWCEVARRLCEIESDQPRRWDTTFLSAEGESTAGAIPKHLSTLIDKLRELGGALDHPARTSRFAVPESAVAAEIRVLLDQPEWQLGDGIALMPSDLATPVLEDGIVRINLDWEWMAPGSGWMELQLVAVLDDGEVVLLDHDEMMNDESDAPVALRLCGDAWQQLCQSCERDELEAAFGEMLLAHRASALGTGTIVVGLVSLATT